MACGRDVLADHAITKGCNGSATLLWMLRSCALPLCWTIYA